jgi:heparanase
MRNVVMVAALGSALGVGWMRWQGTGEVRTASDAVVRSALAFAYGEAPRAHDSANGPVVVAIDRTESRGEVDERFLSVALDTSQVLGGRWWSRDANSIEFGRGDQRTAAFDFSRARLRTLAAGLAPAYLRVGGTEADVVYYDMSATGGAPPKPYELVLTRDRWDSLNEFARNVGYKLIFTVNAGPGTRTDGGRWSSQNADALLEYTRSAGYDVPVWELGNEVDGYWFTHGLSGRVSGKQYAEDLATFREHVHSVFPGSKVAGPAAFFWPVTGEAGSFVVDFMRDFLAAGGPSADVVTWHFYPQQSRRCPVATRRASPTELLDPVALDEAAKWADRVDDLAAKYAPHAPVWLGETGNAQCGGEPGVSDRFVGSLWWVDELGLSARHGQGVVVRQTLSGSNYGLLEDERLEPNPDYWASLLWKRLMGRVVLGVQTSNGDDFVRTYAHCTPDGNGVSLLAVNLHADRHATVRVEGYGADARLYLVTAPSLASPDAYLNGKRLRFDQELPALEPALGAVRDGAVDLPPASYAFVVSPDADAAACKTPPHASR